MVEVGRLQLCHYRSGAKVERKDDSSPVTVADRESEIAIEKTLRAFHPDIPIVAEEATSLGRTPKIGARFFLVDPLDGTREFINDRDEFTVNIGLIEDGRPTFGIVYAPALSSLYVTVGPNETVGGTLVADADARTLGELELKRMCTRAPDMEALTVVASRSHGDKRTEEILAGYQVSERRSAGSSLKFCLIASGLADFYPRPGRTMEWDTCAGHAVLTAAGGHVSTLEGAPLTYGKVTEGFANPGFQAWGNSG